MKKTAKSLRVLAAVLATSLAFSACGGAASSASAAASAQSASQTQQTSFDPNINAKGVLPIAKEPVTLRMAILGNPLVTDFTDNDFTRWVEEQTNIKLEIEVLPSKDVDTKLNLMFAAGKDLPDIINVTNISNDALYKYALDGLVQPLNAYMEEYGDAFTKMLADNDGLTEAITAPDENIYGIPKYNVTEHNMLKYGKMYLYQPWLDKLGLEVPKTVEDLYTVLQAFKTQDPNGNGVADEIPLAGATTGAGTDPLLALMAPFIPYDQPNNGLYNDNGTIIASYTTPEFKQGLEYVNRLVGEKLLDPVSFTQDQEQLKQLANREEVILGGFVHAYTAVNANDPRLMDYVCLPLLEGGTEKGGFLKDPLLPKGPSYVITKDCKNADAAYRLGDFLTSVEAGMRNRYGVEGRDWEYVDPKTTEYIGIDGEPARFKIINNVWGETGNVMWRSECLYYYDYDTVYGSGFLPDAHNPDLYHATNSKKYFKPYVVADVVPVKSLFFTKEELSDYSIIATSLNDHVKQQIAAFATGIRSLNDWDAFQKEVQNLGVEQYLKYVQTAYDRQFGA